MWRLITAAALLGMTAGCAPESLKVVDYKALSDENLTEYYSDLERDIRVARKEWEKASLAGTPLRSEVRKDQHEALVNRRRQVLLEMEGRKLEVPAPAKE